MASKINYANKAPFQTREEIPDENKVNAEDMNEIKKVVNANADELDTAKEDIESLQGGQGTSNAEITSLKNRVTTLEGDNATNKADISSLKTDNETNKSDIEELQEDNETNKTNITNLQNNKVDKVEGKGLSTNDFDNTYKEKLDGLSNYDDTEIKQDITELEGKVSTLEEDNTTNKTNIETLQEDNIKNKQDISDLQESQNKQNEVLNDVIYNLFPSETQEGENVNIKNTIPVKFKEFVVKGNSKQETRSGKNIFNKSASPEYPSAIQNVEGNVNVSVANKEGTEQQVVTFPLVQGQKLMLGDYLAEDEIHHKRKQIELDYNDYTLQLISAGLCCLTSNNWDYTTAKGLCSHFKNAENDSIASNSSASALPDGYFNFRMGSTKDRIYFKNSNFATLEDWQNFFNNNNVILEYELAEEEIEAYTEEQQEAYKQICNLKAYEEETNVYSTNEISPIFKVTAIKDFNSVITQLNKALLERS